MTTKLASAVCALSLLFCGSAATIQSASAQAPTVPAPPLAGPPSPEQVQPWGLPPTLTLLCLGHRLGNWL